MLSDEPAIPSPAACGSGGACPAPPDPATEAALDEARWMIEEFRVSLFAQQLGTAGPVSEQRIRKKLGL